MPADPEPFTPNHRHLYILVAGVVLGILLGQAVLGRWPDVYQKYFRTVSQAQADLANFDQQTNAIVQNQMQALGESMATSVAAKELLQGYAAQRHPFEDRLRDAHRTAGLMLGLIIAVVITMVVETLPPPDAHRARSRLATLRYILIAAWLALIIAQPELLADLSLPFLAALLTLALALAFIPSPRSLQPPAPTP